MDRCANSEGTSSCLELIILITRWIRQGQGEDHDHSITELKIGQSASRSGVPSQEPVASKGRALRCASLFHNCFYFSSGPLYPIHPIFYLIVHQTPLCHKNCPPNASLPQEFENEFAAARPLKPSFRTCQSECSYWPYSAIMSYVVSQCHCGCGN